MIRALIVEDEKPIADLVATMVTEIDSRISIVGQCDNILSAYQMIQQEKPQLVFMDIMLPGGSSLELLSNIEIDFEIIFITAYNEFIIEAMRHAPNGYISKPINKEDLTRAINHAQKRISKGLNADELVHMLQDMMKKEEKRNKLVIPAADEYVFIDVASIVHCEGSNVYTYIHTTDKKKILSSYTLKQMFGTLPHDVFFQIHKSHIISLNEVVKFNSKELSITMSDNTCLPLARNKRDEFLNHFLRINRKGA